MFSGMRGGSSESYNDITPRLILGGLPTYKIPDCVGMVLDVSTYCELAEFTLPDHVQQIFLHVPDGTAHATPEDALDAILQAQAFLQDNPDKKIHCQPSIA
jgi:hypothetical protein